MIEPPQVREALEELGVIVDEQDPGAVGHQAPPGGEGGGPAIGIRRKNVVPDPLVSNQMAPW